MKTTVPGLIEKPALQRTLNNRHIQLMAMGGAIGTGLFMGSGKIIALSGTSIILIYMIIGLFVYFVMRAMGELLLSNLNFKSFADFAGAYLGPRAAFFLGWSYWLSWSVAVVGYAIPQADGRKPSTGLQPALTRRPHALHPSTDRRAATAAADHTPLRLAPMVQRPTTEHPSRHDRPSIRAILDAVSSGHT